jgi:hypothetical protein
VTVVIEDGALSETACLGDKVPEVPIAFPHLRFGDTVPALRNPVCDSHHSDVLGDEDRVQDDNVAGRDALLYELDLAGVAAEPAGLTVVFGSILSGWFYLPTNFTDVFVISIPALDELVGAGLLPKFGAIGEPEPLASVLAVAARLDQEHWLNIERCEKER